MSGPLGSSQWMYSAGGGSFYGTQINQSLRGNEADSPYLSRTPASAGNQKTSTFSAWVKLSQELTSFSFLGAGSSGSAYFLFGIEGDDLYFEATGTVITRRSDMELRDSAAWYHLMFVLDTTQGTANDRVKLYKNGVQITSFSSITNPSQNADISYLNTASVQYIGYSPALSGTYMNGYMAEVNFLDGIAAAPTDFGEFKDGVWIPKSYSGSYGTNGFYLPFPVTQGDSAFFDGSGDSLKFTNASHYDIGSSDDFTVEFFFNHTTATSYGNFLGNYASGGPHFLLGFDNRTEKDFYFYTGNGASFMWQLSDNNGIVGGKWHHVAFQRNGTVLRCYVDGVRQTTLTDPASNTGYTISGGNVTDFNKAYDLAHMELGSPTAADFAGFLSNVRLVIGASVYANDDNNITVPTATLSNVSGTALLSLTTGDITKDSSSNNVTGTVSGDAVYRQNNPFSSIIGKDAAGSNDFAASGLAFTDIVPDSPTQNFATYNINVNTGQTGTYAEGNLAVTASGTWSTNVWRQGSIGVTGGAGGEKYYFEFVTTLTGGGQATGVGVQDSRATTSTLYTQGVVYYNTVINANGSSVITGLTINPASNVLRFAFDASNGKVWIGNSTGWYNSGDPAGGTGEVGTIANYDGSILVPITNRTSTAGTHTFNFGQDSTFAALKTSGSANGSDGNGIGDFYYAPPSGFLALANVNLPDSTIGPGQDTLAEDYFVPYLYTADNTSPKARTGVGFAPDFLWFKDRTTGFSHNLYDTVRGVNKGLQTNNTNAENSYTLMTAFGADGFTTSTNGTTGNILNYSTDAYVAWSWKAGGTPTATNSAGAGNVPTSGSVLIDGVASTSALAGTIAANKISANTAAGFSIINYTGNGSSSQTVGHGLSSTPQFLIMKDRGSNSNNGQWNAWHKYAGDGDDYGYLSTTSAFTGAAQIIPNGTDTIELKANLTTSNQSGHSFIMYAFHSVEGYSKVGKYLGNGSADGTFVYTGFQPSFILTKKSSAAGDNWTIYDTARDPDNVTREYLIPNASQAAASTDTFDILSNGFKIRTAGAWVNTSGQTYIYLAFAETPFKYANAR